MILRSRRSARTAVVFGMVRPDGPRRPVALADRRRVGSRLRAGRSPWRAPSRHRRRLHRGREPEGAPTGDEPHFLLIIDSLSEDGDFDLWNNYRDRDSLEYDPRQIRIRMSSRKKARSRLTRPAYPLRRRRGCAAGRAGVERMLAFLTVAGFGPSGRSWRRAGFGPRARTGALLEAAWTLLLASMAGHIFSEAPVFVLVALGFRAVFAPVLAGRETAALVQSQSRSCPGCTRSSSCSRWRSS